MIQLDSQATATTLTVVPTLLAVVFFSADNPLASTLAVILVGLAFSGLVMLGLNHQENLEREKTVTDDFVPGT